MLLACYDPSRLIQRQSGNWGKLGHFVAAGAEPRSRRFIAPAPDDGSGEGVAFVTRNQCRAAALAAEICGGRRDAAMLSEEDWHLLLLAADLNNPLSLPLLVCNRVLDRAARGVGYFDHATLAAADDPHPRCRTRPTVASGLGNASRRSAWPA